jgi:hypothetical protein
MQTTGNYMAVRGRPGVVAIILALVGCDDSVQNQTGVVTRLQGLLVCVASVDASEAEFCALAENADDLNGAEVGSCVRIASDWAGVPGGSGTAVRPERLVGLSVETVETCS